MMHSRFTRVSFFIYMLALVGILYRNRVSFIEGFHDMTSYHANFASRHSRDRHVGFLLAWHRIGKHNKMSRYLLFSSYDNTK